MNTFETNTKTLKVMGLPEHCKSDLFYTLRFINLNRPQDRNFPVLQFIEVDEGWKVGFTPMSHSSPINVHHSIISDKGIGARYPREFDLDVFLGINKVTILEEVKHLSFDAGEGKFLIECTSGKVTFKIRED